MAGWRIGFLRGLLVGLAFLVGCAQATGSVPETGKSGQAVVQSVEVAQVVSQTGAALSPGEVRVLVHGTLPDTCMLLAEPVVSQSRNFIVVILEQQSSGGTKGCASNPRSFDRVVTLGQNLPPGHYTVSVNGVQTAFDLQGTAVVSAAQATPTRPAAAQPTAVAQPTATASSTAVLPSPTAVSQQPVASNLPEANNPPATNNQPGANNQPSNDQQSTGSQEPAAQTSTSRQPEACDKKAAFFADLSVPDGTIFDPGQSFTKSWRLRNAGTCSWSGYSLAFQGGDPLGARNTVPLPGTTAPGDTVDVSINMTAPQTPGGYYSNWQLSASDGTIFGLGAGKNGLLWLKIGVRTVLPATATEPVCAFQTDPSVEAQVLQLINQARADRGLKPLQRNEKIDTAARNHSQDMACKDFVEHYGSDGSTWFTRIKAEGVRYRSASENIYAGNPQFGGTALGAFNWWMNSQIHRDNILDPLSTLIGVGYIYYDGSTYKGYYTLDFTRP